MSPDVAVDDRIAVCGGGKRQMSSWATVGE
jgi:hypothetical protein